MTRHRFPRGTLHPMVSHPWAKIRLEKTIGEKKEKGERWGRRPKLENEDFTPNELGRRVLIMREVDKSYRRISRELGIDETGRAKVDKSTIMRFLRKHKP